MAIVQGGSIENETCAENGVGRQSESWEADSGDSLDQVVWFRSEKELFRLVSIRKRVKHADRRTATALKCN